MNVDGNTTGNATGRIIETSGVFEFLEESRFCTRVPCIVSYHSSEGECVQHSGVRITGPIFRNVHQPGVVIVSLNGEAKHRALEPSQVKDVNSRISRLANSTSYNEMTHLGVQTSNQTTCDEMPTKRAKTSMNYRLNGHSHRVNILEERNPGVSMY